MPTGITDPIPKCKESVDPSPSPTHPDLTLTNHQGHCHPPWLNPAWPDPLNPASSWEEIPLHQDMSVLPLRGQELRGDTTAAAPSSGNGEGICR